MDEEPVLILDIDGTIGARCDRDVYDNDRAIDDLLHVDVLSHAYAIAACAGATVVVMTGRSERFRAVTTAWLDKHQVRREVLLMRPDGDERPDDVVKRDLWERHLKARAVVACFDDRPGVIAMWRSLGFRAYEVAEADY